MRYNRFYSDKVGRYILNRFQDYFSKIQRSSIRKSRNENNMCHKKYIERNSRMDRTADRIIRHVSFFN